MRSPPSSFSELQVLWPESLPADTASSISDHDDVHEPRPMPTTLVTSPPTACSLPRPMPAERSGGSHVEVIVDACADMVAETRWTELPRDDAPELLEQRQERIDAIGQCFRRCAIDCGGPRAVGRLLNGICAWDRGTVEQCASVVCLVLAAYIAHVGEQQSHADALSGPLVSGGWLLRLLQRLDAGLRQVPALRSHAAEFRPWCDVLAGGLAEEVSQFDLTSRLAAYADDQATRCAPGSDADLFLRTAHRLLTRKPVHRELSRSRSCRKS